MKMNTHMKLIALAVTASLSSVAFPTVSFAAEGGAEESSEIAKSKEEHRKEEGTEIVTIIGTAQQSQKVAGSAHSISQADLEKTKYTDVNRALKQIPGINLQLEDGLGLRPNIGIRGTSTERSGRITLMEDGILIAPAPYAASSAYYFPTFDRITGIEVLKGSAAIEHGPFTVGGAINLLSRPIPEESKGGLTLEFGENAEQRGHVYYGQNFDNFAYIVEANKHLTDGFKSIDFTGNDTGFDKEDYLVKLRFNSDIDAEIYQQLDLKVQHSTEDSDQTYLGLTDRDFAANPYRQYSATQLDNFQGEHDQYLIHYLADFGNDMNLHLTAYENKTHRNWFKTGALLLADANDPTLTTRYSWSNVINDINMGGSNAGVFQNFLNGADSLNDRVEMRDNNRDYRSEGIQARLDWDFEIGESEHTLRVGVRKHEDQEDRYQRNSFYMQQNGELVLTDSGTWGNAGNRIQSAEAMSYFITDTIVSGDWIFTPGVRYEDIDLRRQDWGKTEGRLDSDLSERENSVSKALPGFGALWAMYDSTILLMGVNRGFTPPGNDPRTSPEESWNYEFGVRFNGQGILGEIIGFYSDYDNILGECSQSNSGCDANNQGDKYNGGQVTVKGLEIVASTTVADNWPLRLAYTFTESSFGSSFENDAWGDVTKGDSIPYIPEHQLQFTAGYEANDWSIISSFNFTDGFCTKPECGGYQQIDSRFLVDVAAEYTINDSVSVFATIDNLLDNDRIVAREPYGARPDKPRTAKVGVSFQF